MKRVIWVVLPLAAIFGASCSSGDVDSDVANLKAEVTKLQDEVSTLSSTVDDMASTTAPQSSSTSSIPAPSTTVISDAAARSLFVELATEACDLSLIPDPATAQVAQGEGSLFVITDVEGERLLLDPGARIVTSMEGPDGVMPRDYSFNCEPETFVGTLDH